MADRDPASPLLAQLEAARYAQMAAVKSLDAAILAERERLRVLDDVPDGADLDTRTLVRGRPVFGGRAGGRETPEPSTPPTGLPLGRVTADA